MNTLDLNVQIALDHGLVLTAVEPRSKDWIDLEMIDTFDGWRAAQDQHGPHINAAVHLNPSDLCILDLDTFGGLAVLSQQLILPPTMTVLTARGLHLYFRRGTHHGDAGEVWVGEQPLGQYICGNVLAHYALLPGSLHPSGALYTWLRLPGEGIADLPPELHNWVAHDHGRGGPYWDFSSGPYDDFEGWDD